MIDIRLAQFTAAAVTFTTVLACGAPEQEDTSADDPMLRAADYSASPGREQEVLSSRVVTSPELIGRELAVPIHLSNGEEFSVSSARLLQHGESLFTARWTSQDGVGRPFGKGNDGDLVNPDHPLVFPRMFNIISGPASGACSGCHNEPRAGGGGDIVGNVFVLGNRFDFASFDRSDTLPTSGAFDERGVAATLQTIANSRKTTGMFGSGYIELLARQMTRELREAAASCPLEGRCALSAKGTRFGSIEHRADGTWDTSGIEGLPNPSVQTSGTVPPTLIIQPFFQSGAVISLRQFSINSFTRLHGVQAEERFEVDQDQDGFSNELTRADVTAVAVFQATLPPPGQLIPRDPLVASAIVRGEREFSAVGCASCHTPALPLQDANFTEPNPYNPAGNLQLSSGVDVFSIDLASDALPSPRLAPEDGVTWVPAYTDLKLHDITTGKPACAWYPELIADGQCDADVEPLSQNHTTGTADFYRGNSKFLTRRLWGIANQHAFGHHGKYTTLREAILAHHGEAEAVRANFIALDGEAQATIIEFLRSLQILPAGTPCFVIDEHGVCRGKPSN